MDDFIKQFQGRWPWYIEILTVSVLFFRSPGIFRSKDSFLLTFHLGMKHREEKILRTEDAGISEEEDTNSQDFNIPKDHGHLAWNCVINIITLAMKALVVL